MVTSNPDLLIFHFLQIKGKTTNIFCKKKAVHTQNEQGACYIEGHPTRDIHKGRYIKKNENSEDSGLTSKFMLRTASI